MSDIPELLRRALALHQEGRLDDAERLYGEILASAPDHAGALGLFGLSQAQRGRYQAASDLLSRAVAADPSNPAAFYNLGNVLRELKAFERAIDCYDRALAAGGDDPGTLNNRACVLFDLGRFDEALAGYERVIALQPGRPGAHINRGNALLALSRFDESLSSYRRALTISPDHADALFGHGKALMNLLRYEEALASYSRTVAVDPRHADAHADTGHLLFQLGRYREALTAYDRAAAIAPNLAHSHKGRGDTLFKLGRGEEACAAYDKALSAESGMEYLEGVRLLTKMYVCDWSDLERERRHVLARVLEARPAADPFAFLMIGETPFDQLVCARAYAAAKYPPSPVPMWGKRTPHAKICVGYLSGEFREQATGYLIADLFECHDRSAFELHAVSTGIDDGGAMRRRIKAAFDVFSDVSRRSDREAAEQIARAGIDILVNLNGFFGEERTGLVAFKPSPIQVNYLGFPGTMGAPYMDYILADRWIIPADQQ